MSRFMLDKVIDGGDVSGNLASTVIDFRYAYGYAVQANLTGSPTGTILVQGSCDQTNWTTISTLTISGTTSQYDNKDAIYWPYIKVTKASGGTGTLTVWLTTKGA